MSTGVTILSGLLENQDIGNVQSKEGKIIEEDKDKYKAIDDEEAEDDEEEDRKKPQPVEVNWNDLKSQSSMKNEYSSALFSKEGIEDQEEDIDNAKKEMEEHDAWQEDWKYNSDILSEGINGSESDTSSIQSNEVIHFNIQLNPFKQSQRFTRHTNQKLPTTEDDDQHITSSVLKDKEMDEIQEHEENRKEKLDSVEGAASENEDNFSATSDTSSLPDDDVIHFNDILNNFKLSYRFYHHHSQSMAKDESLVSSLSKEEKEVDESGQTDEDNEDEDELKRDCNGELESVEVVASENSSTTSDISSLQDDDVIHFNDTLNNFKYSNKFYHHMSLDHSQSLAMDESLVSKEDEEEEGEIDVYLYRNELDQDEEDKKDEDESKRDCDGELESVEVVSSENSSMTSETSSLQGADVIHFNDTLNNFRCSHRFYHHMNLDHSQSMAKDESLVSSLPKEEEELGEKDDYRYKENESDQDEEKKEEEDELKRDCVGKLEMIPSENSSTTSDTSSLPDDDVIHFNDTLNNFKYSHKFYHHMSLDHSQSMIKDESFVSKEEVEEGEMDDYRYRNELDQDEEDKKDEDESKRDCDGELESVEVVASENSSMTSETSSLPDDNVIHFNDTLNNFRHSHKFYHHMNLDHSQSLANDESLVSSLSEEEEEVEEKDDYRCMDNDSDQDEDKEDEDGETMLDVPHKYSTEEDEFVEEQDATESTHEQINPVASGKVWEQINSVASGNVHVSRSRKKIFSIRKMKRRLSKSIRRLFTCVLPSGRQ